MSAVSASNQINFQMKSLSRSAKSRKQAGVCMCVFLYMCVCVRVGAAVAHCVVLPLSYLFNCHFASSFMPSL